MFLSIGPISFDTTGAQVMNAIPGRTDAHTHTRRGTRSQLLDGTSYTYDGGYSAGDRSISASVEGSQSLYTALSYLQQSYAELIIVIDDGAFVGAIRRLNRNGQFIDMLFEVNRTA